MKTLQYAIRFLLRARTYTAINLIGLSLTLACCIILTRYIYRELTVDAHGKDLSTIVVPLRDVEGTVYPGENPVWEGDKSMSIGERWIREQCRVVEWEGSTIVYENRAFQSDLLAADSTFFHFFSYQLAEGSLDLCRPDGAILTEEYARRLFGKESPIGKNLTYDKWVLTVTGVIRKPLCKTTWNFDLLVSRQLKPKWGRLNIGLMRVDPHLDLNEVNRKSNVYRNVSDALAASQCRYKYLRWKDFYFESSVADKYERIFQFGNRNYVYILSGVDAFLFLIGILSFVNLYSATMLRRTKVYGLKKVFGISRGRLFVEMYLENLLLIVGAVLLAWGMIELSSGYVERLFTEHVPGTSFDWQLTGGLLFFLPLLVTLLFYVRYVHLNPVGCMRFWDARSGKPLFRLVLLFFQYVITLYLVILSLYFQRHFDFLMHTPHGYETKGILTADLYRENLLSSLGDMTAEQRKQQWHSREVVGQKLDECPFIESWMNSHASIQSGSFSDIVNDKGETSSLWVTFISVDFVKMFGLKVLEGNISEMDSYDKYQIVLNESAMKALGYKKMSQASVRSTSPLWISMTQGKVVKHGTSLMPVDAVVADFYPRRLTDGVPPMLLVIQKNSLGKVLMKSVPGKEKELIAYLRKMEQEIYHTDDFTYEWMEDTLADMYKDDKRTSDVYALFSYMAVLVSCLGLLGISLFEIRRRYREIAIRKVNGATPKDLYWLLGRRYFLTQMLAFVVAVPLAWWTIYHYTSGFAVKAPVTIELFLSSLLIVMVVSLATLFWQIRRASRINPVAVIKTE